MMNRNGGKNDGNSANNQGTTGAAGQRTYHNGKRIKDGSWQSWRFCDIRQVVEKEEF